MVPISIYQENNVVYRNETELKPKKGDLNKEI